LGSITAHIVRDIKGDLEATRAGNMVDQEDLEDTKEDSVAMRVDNTVALVVDLEAREDTTEAEDQGGIKEAQEVVTAAGNDINYHTSSRMEFLGLCLRYDFM